MRKVVLAFLMLILVSSVVFAADANYGFRIKTDYDFYVNYGESEPAEKKLGFSFYPYFESDFFDLVLKAEWKPDENGKNGFDHLLDVDTSEWNKTLDSVADFIDEMKIDLTVLKINLKHKLDDDLSAYLDSDVAAAAYQMGVKLDLKYLKIGIDTTNFVLKDNKYNNVHDATVDFKVGGFGLGAKLIRIINVDSPEKVFELNGRVSASGDTQDKFVPKAKMYYQAENGDYRLELSGQLNAFTLIDSVNTPGDERVDFPGRDAFSNFAAELAGEVKVGKFDLKENFYVCSGVENYNNIAYENRYFYYSTEVKFNFNSSSFISFFGSLPFKTDGIEGSSFGEKIYSAFITKDNEDKDTFDRFELKTSFGSGMKIGAGVEIRHLISDIHNKKSVGEMLVNASPWLKLSVDTHLLSGEVKLTADAFNPLNATVTTKFTLNVENFF